MNKFERGILHTPEYMSKTLVNGLLLSGKPYPSAFLEGVVLTERLYTCAVENLAADAEKRIRHQKRKDFDLTDEQINRIVRVTVGGYKVYSKNEEERETFKRNLFFAVLKEFVEMGILSKDDWGRDLCENKDDTVQILKTLNNEVSYINNFGKEELRSQAYVIAAKIKKSIALNITAMSIQIRSKQFGEALKKVSKPDSLNEFFERYVS